MRVEEAEKLEQGEQKEVVKGRGTFEKGSWHLATKEGWGCILVIECLSSRNSANWGVGVENKET